VRAGPTAVRYLADWGADCIKVEMPPSAGEMDMGGPRHGPDFQNLHRNKRSITLNLKEPDGKAVFMKLVEQADVVVENYRADVKFRLGIDYESLKKVNPKIILGSISGFGQDGPYAERAGFDQIAQGMGGLMSITGLPGQGPVRVGIPVADLTAGLFCALGVLTALHEREVSGEGQHVCTSLLQAQIFMLDFQASRWLMKGEVPKQAGNDHPTSIPTGVFPTSDGYINIAAAGDKMWKRAALALGAQALIDHPEHATPALRSHNRKALNERLAEVTKTNTSAHWIESLNKAGVPCGPINTIDKTFAEPQVQHLGIARPVQHPALGEIKVVGQPINLSDYPQPKTLNPTPDLGQHTDEVLAGLGYDAKAIAGLKSGGAV